MSEAPRTCSTCAHSRDKDGAVFVGADRAFCAHVDVLAAQPDQVGRPPCETQNFDPEGVCGSSKLLWEPRA